VHVVGSAELTVEGELDDGRVRQLVRRFERLLREGEAAGLRARGGRCAAALVGAVDQRDALWRGAIAEADLTTGGAVGIEDAFEFPRRHHVGEVVGGPGLELELRAGCDDHGADLALYDLVPAFEADDPERAGPHARDALAAVEVQAVLLVDERRVGQSAGVGDVDRLALGHAGVVLVRYARRADARAGVDAAVAAVDLDVARMLADFHREVAQIAEHLADLG